jgi:molybdate transport system substrate-binding protein
MIRTIFGGLAVAWLLLLPARASAQTVFAAASLTDAMKDISAAWQKLGHPALTMSFASSSTLARQIEQGAQANIFASADEKWMDYLQARGLIVNDSRRDLLSNSLVLVVPASSRPKEAKPATIEPGFDLTGLLGKDGRLTTGDPAHVPVGIYAEQALRKLGLWDAVSDRIAPSDSVRAALLLVERGEAPAGIVYSTDAAVSPGLAIAGVFPASSHDPIEYPFALVRGQDSPEAKALLEFIEGPEGRRIFDARGFVTE